jgi:hypothetical protein
MSFLDFGPAPDTQSVFRSWDKAITFFPVLLFAHTAQTAMGKPVFSPLSLLQRLGSCITLYCLRLGYKDLHGLQRSTRGHAIADGDVGQNVSLPLEVWAILELHL